MRNAAVFFVLVALIYAGGPLVLAKAAWVRPPAHALVVKADWQGPRALPRRFRNHCRFDLRYGRVYCSDHCGRDYQFYFCGRDSFGCCRVGFGYCDWTGMLRCAP